MKKKLIWIISHVEKSIVFEIQLSHLKNVYDISVILLNPSYSKFDDFLKQHNINYYRFKLKNKLDFIKCFFQVIYILLKLKPHIVHCHLLEAQIIGLLAAWFTRIPKRVYTRHNSNYHHVYFPSSVKYDLLSNYAATHIISLSPATYHTLIKLEKVSPSKVYTIYHPFVINRFSNISEQEVSSIREKWNINPNKYIIGVISRYIHWKGIQYIIPAFQKFLNYYPNALLILANAYGPYEKEIKSLLKLLPEDSYMEIPFEENIYALYKTFNLFIHTPIDPLCEAFGQVYVEALGMQIPSIFTLSGIAREIIKDKHNALVVPFKNSDAIYERMLELYKNNVLKEQLKNNGPKSVNVFDKNIHLQKLLHLYNN